MVVRFVDIKMCTAAMTENRDFAKTIRGNRDLTDDICHLEPFRVSRKYNDTSSIHLVKWGTRITHLIVTNCSASCMQMRRMCGIPGPSATAQTSSSAVRFSFDKIRFSCCHRRGKFINDHWVLQNFYDIFANFLQNVCLNHKVNSFMPSAQLPLKPRIILSMKSYFVHHFSIDAFFFRLCILFLGIHVFYLYNFFYSHIQISVSIPNYYLAPISILRLHYTCMLQVDMGENVEFH